VCNWFLALHGAAPPRPTEMALRGATIKRFNFDTLLASDRRRALKYTHIAVVRDPWTRLVSAFLHKAVAPGRFGLTSGMKSISKLTRLDKLTFRQFVVFVKDVPDQHWRPCTEFVGDYRWEHIWKMQELTPRLLELNLVRGWDAPVEHLRKTWQTRHGGKRSADLSVHKLKARANQATRMPRAADFYDDELIQQVAELYKADIDRFGFTPEESLRC
jgi:hypothetical protein